MAFGLRGYWNPFRELARLQKEMNELFESVPWGFDLWRKSEAFPPVNVHSVGDDLIISAELPGMNKDEIDVSVTGTTVTLKGERKPDAVDSERYQRRERRIGSFARTIELPVRVVPDKAEARYVNGVLTIRLPKAEEAKPKRVQVTAG